MVIDVQLLIDPPEAVPPTTRTAFNVTGAGGNLPRLRPGRDAIIAVVHDCGWSQTNRRAKCY